MIAVSSSGKSFRALAWYLASGRTGEERDRVGWTASRNLPTSDPELAATFMRATAAQSDRIQKPVYHIALSFDPSDAVDQPTMERVADRLLERLGLAEHQAIIVAHRDRQHPHLHLLINRVHPETGKAWERWRDQPAIQEVLRAEERALGLREVPGRLAPVPELAGPSPGTQEQEVSRGGSRGNGEPAIQAAGDGPTPAYRSAPAPVAELARQIRAYERAGELTRRQYDLGIVASAARARAAQLDAALDRAQAGADAFLAALKVVYRDSEQARRSYLAMAAEHGVGPASRTMRDRPEVFGELRTVERPRVLGLVRGASDAPARAAARIAADRGQLAVEAERALLSRASEAHARRIEESFLHQLGAIYREPEAAQAAFERAVSERGIEHAAALLGDRPAAFGQVRESIAREPSTMQAHARAAAELAFQAARVRASRRSTEGRAPEPDVAVERTAAWDAAKLASARAQSFRQDLAGARGAAELEYRIRQGLRALSPRDLERLRLLLTAPQYALVQRLRATVRDIALGREQEAER